MTTVLGKSEQGELTEQDIATLFAARGNDLIVATRRISPARSRFGDAVSYVVNRNINYTNVCYFHCKFAHSPRGARRSR